MGLGEQTAAEGTALAALRGAHPRLAGGFGAALRQARAVALGKLWVALSRERIDGLVPLPGHGRAGIVLADGTRLTAPPAIADAFAEHAAGLVVTQHSAIPRRIGDPVALLGVVLGARPGRADDDRWRQFSGELADSVANHALALVGESWRRERLTSEGAPGRHALRWAAQRAATDQAFSPLALFERAVVDGHPLHPCARIRGGMSAEELLRYAPEWADEITIRVVAIARCSFTQASLTQASLTQSHRARRGMTAQLRYWYPEAAGEAEACLRRAGRDLADYELLPVHPWQLRRVSRDWDSGGKVIAMTRARIPARPLLSLRTLAPAADRRAAHIKTSLSVRLTTATRLISPATVHNGPVMSALLAGISERERGRSGRLISLPELAAASYRPAPDEPDGVAASLAAIIRESPECHAGDGEVVLPVAALAARSPLTGRPVLAEALEDAAASPRCHSDIAAHFLARYCDCVLPALFSLLSRWGIALEPHGQNALVVLREGLPVRLLYRDFGSIRVSPARLARAGVPRPALMGVVPTDDEDELRAALFFPLIETNLGQLVAALVRVSGTEPARLWELVARRCRSVYATLTADPAIAAQADGDEAVLFGATLAVKSMLRVQLSADPHVPRWVMVPNPLVAL
ncbi:MAG TPA: IucA/IucC family protein [Pseudonocardiaceae bacterium]|nr:IucA/IucC family protein [Pseudonocardiaceae bacterium]